jgi:hypothetical protein
MSSHDPVPPDDIDALLSPTAMPADRELREAILCRTNRILHRRRYVRRMLLVAAMFVCYAAGATTMQVWNRPASGIVQPGIPKGDSPIFAARKPGQSPNHSAIHSPAKPKTAAAAPASNNHLATHQPAAPLSPYQRLRRYSDRLLEQQGDIALAARYYARALDKASTEERAISVEDTWLLTALKADRFPENSHENHGS